MSSTTGSAGADVGQQRLAPEHDRTGLAAIRVTTGVGTGATPLSAFDAALFEAGIANYNLLVLSSVIPTGAQVLVKHPDIEGGWGDRLYVVLAEQRAVAVGEEAWAGIGWIQNSETGQGLFVEHHGASEAEVREQAHASLSSMRSYRPETFDDVQLVVRGAQCHGSPVCALVAAVYRSSPW